MVNDDDNYEQQEETTKLLPIANVGRIMKGVLPPRTKISREAKETMQECASEFISFVTAEASEKCQKENRKTLNGEDICWSLSSLGLDIYTEVLLRYLHNYRQHCERQKAANKNTSTTTTSAKGAAAAASNINVVVVVNEKDDDDEELARSNSANVVSRSSDINSCRLQRLAETPVTFEFINVLDDHQN